MPQDKAQSGPSDPSLKPKAYQPNARVQKLMAIGKWIVTNPQWRPADGKTFCNMALCRAAHSFGYDGFVDAKNNPLMANEMINKMVKDSQHWKSATAEDAWENAVLGGLSVACYSENPHGHVAVLAPAPKMWSQKWTAYVPQVYNVGKTMNLNSPYTMSEGFAFIYRPNHYILI